MWSEMGKQTAQAKEVYYHKFYVTIGNKRYSLTLSSNALSAPLVVLHQVQRGNFQRQVCLINEFSVF